MRWSSVLTYGVLLASDATRAEQVTVRHTEGVVHGFLVLRTLQGDALAAGDMTQVARGDRVTNKLVFRFKDGSIHEETAVFSQRRSFRLLSDHLVQKGPAFPRPVDVSIDGPGGRVTVKYQDKDGNEKVTTERMELPADIANGMMFTLLKNIAPGAAKTTVSIVGVTPKPQLVKLEITPAGEEPFSVAGITRHATHYVLKVEIGGVKGLLASLMGKEPPDHHVWILPGEAPAFVKSEGSLYLGGPSWRIELTSPVWPGASERR